MNTDWTSAYNKSKAHIGKDQNQTLPYHIEIMRLDGVPKTKVDATYNFFKLSQFLYLTSTLQELNFETFFRTSLNVLFHSLTVREELALGPPGKAILVSIHM